MIVTLPERELLTSAQGHAFYPTAARTLCGADIPELEPGAPPAPTCPACLATSLEFDRIDGSVPQAWRGAPHPRIRVSKGPYGLRAEHGTRSRYAAGCKCKPCLRAEADYRRDRYHVRKARAAA